MFFGIFSVPPDEPHQLRPPPVSQPVDLVVAEAGVHQRPDKVGGGVAKVLEQLIHEFKCWQSSLFNFCHRYWLHSLVKQVWRFFEFKLILKQISGKCVNYLSR